MPTLRIEDHIRDLAPHVGDAFHTRDLCARMEAMTPVKLFPALQRLKDQGKIRFTGRRCWFERLS